MEFTFQSDVKTWDMWKLSMYHIYHSLTGVCNIIFTAAAILLFFRFWNSMEGWQAGIVMICCLLFPVIQPVVVYSRASAQVSALPKNMEYVFNETHLHVIAGDKDSYIPWGRIRGISKEPGMIILVAEAGRGYMLTDRAMGHQKEEFLTFAEERIKTNRKAG